MFTWLNTFIVAAECENFRRTAEILYISQPSVTLHIKLLEKEIGVELFRRVGRRIKLTEEGKRYLQSAKEIIQVYQSGLEDLKSFRKGYKTNLSLAISPLIADTILPYVLKNYVKAHPEVEVSIKILESAVIEDVVINGEVDIGLSCLRSSNPEVSCELLYNDRVIFVAPHDGLDFESAVPLDAEEILNSSYLLTHNHPSYWDDLCKSIKFIYPNVRMMKVSQVHITKRFIAEGLGVSFLPLSTVRRELMEGRLLEIECQRIKLPDANTYALMKYNRAKQKEFISFLSGYRF